VGKVSPKKKKKNWVAVGEKMKFQKNKNKDQGEKKLGGGQGENKVGKKKLISGLRKGKEKKSTWDGTGIEKRLLSVHHPSTLVHWCVLVHLARADHLVSVTGMCTLCM
jgi:hypothetical protein